jgi:hypothetical protein
MTTNFENVHDIEGFEKMQHYKVYFPLNNCEYLIKRYNVGI